MSALFFIMNNKKVRPTLVSLPLIVRVKWEYKSQGENPASTLSIKIDGAVPVVRRISSWHTAGAKSMSINEHKVGDGDGSAGALAHWCKSSAAPAHLRFLPQWRSIFNWVFSSAGWLSHLPDYQQCEGVNVNLKNQLILLWDHWINVESRWEKAKGNICII